MNPVLEPFETNDDSFGFTLSGVNVSIANGIRRTILSDIPLLVFRTSPNDKNKCNIIANTSRLNNEIIKQRLSCIPIHIKDITEFPLKNYIIEVNVENNTDTIMFVTTENFDIKDLVTGKSLSKDKIREIFPADDITGYFIDFVRLRPRISEELPGEKIHLTCEFDIGSAKEDGMFNTVSTCSYGFSGDSAAQDAELARKIQTWKDEGKNEKEIQFESENWKLLDAKRIYKKDSFDFTVQTIGIYSNNEIVDMACTILINKFNELISTIEKDELEIKISDNTMSNCFDIILENEDYTIGKVLEYFLHTKFYETNMMTFCGFKKMHPHDNYSIIRVAYREPADKSHVKGHLKEASEDSIQVYTRLRKDFTKFIKR
jgi:DNA-directed RNA polymerase subunit L